MILFSSKKSRDFVNISATSKSMLFGVDPSFLPSSIDNGAKVPIILTLLKQKLFLLDGIHTVMIFMLCEWWCRKESSGFAVRKRKEMRWCAIWMIMEKIVFLWKTCNLQMSILLLSSLLYFIHSFKTHSLSHSYKTHSLSHSITHSLSHLKLIQSLIISFIITCSTSIDHSPLELFTAVCTPTLKTAKHKK